MRIYLCCLASHYPLHIYIFIVIVWLTEFFSGMYSPSSPAPIYIFMVTPMMNNYVRKSKSLNVYVMILFLIRLWGYHSSSLISLLLSFGFYPLNSANLDEIIKGCDTRSSYLLYQPVTIILIMGRRDGGIESFKTARLVEWFCEVWSGLFDRYLKSLSGPIPDRAQGNPAARCHIWLRRWMSYSHIRRELGRHK